MLRALHDSPIGSHSGVFVTYTRIKKLFAWPQLRNQVQEFVAACSVYQQAKTEKVPYPGLLQPLPVPEQAWQVVSLDFIEGLPTSSKYNCILVVVDKFSKYSHFLKLKHPFSVFTVAKLYMSKFINYMGCL